MFVRLNLYSFVLPAELRSNHAGMLLVFHESCLNDACTEQASDSVVSSMIAVTAVGGSVHIYVVTDFEEPRAGQNQISV